MKKIKHPQGHFRLSRQAQMNYFPLPVIASAITPPLQMYNMESEDPAYHFSNHHYIGAQILVHAEDV